MLDNRFSTLALLAVALLTPKTAQAQDYFYGYYYPNEHRFQTDQLETSGYYDQYRGFGRSIGYQSSPTPAPWVKDAATLRRPSPATIRVYVPDPQAKIWFDGYLTKSTGPVRLFTTPPLDLGTAQHYVVKLIYTLDGREVTQERTVAVLPGHTAVFHFARTANKKTAAAN